MGLTPKYGVNYAKISFLIFGPNLFPYFQGPLTAPHAVTLIEEALRAEDEKSLDILFYRKNGKIRLERFAMKQYNFCKDEMV